MVNDQIINISDKFNVNWNAIREHLNYLELELPRAGGLFGGWSVQSVTGDYRDGWKNFSYYYKNGSLDIKDPVKIGYEPDSAHILYTDACSNDIIDVIEQAKILGMKPNRARLSNVPPGHMLTRHRDGPEGEITLRLHFVIKTNPAALFMTDNGNFHLEEDNVYLINVGEFHNIRNYGNDSRTHLIMNVYEYATDLFSAR